jgi:hypothetical protein
MPSILRTLPLRKNGVSVQLETVTPSMAKKWLELGTGHNVRRLNRARVVRYATAISNGAWDTNGESIKFDAAGALIDGQHRLAGCVEAGKPFTTVVMRGVSSMVNIDSGMPRSLQQLVSHEIGGDALPNVSMAVRIYANWEAGGRTPATLMIGPGSRAGDRSHYLSVLAQHEGLVLLTRNISKRAALSHIPIFPWALAFTAYAGKRALPHAADEYFVAVVLGEGNDSDEKNPLMALRRHLLHIPKASRISTIGRFETVFLMVRAWNLWNQGARRSSIRGTVGGPMGRGRRRSYKDGEQIYTESPKLPEFYTGAGQTEDLE